MTREPRSIDPEALLARRGWIRAIARSLLADRNAADDVEQRAIVKALEARGPIRSLKGWLRRVVRSAVIDEHRSASRRRGREAAVARPDVEPSTARLVEQAEAQSAVAREVTRLPEPYRSTVLLRYFEELAPMEIARRTGVPVETVRTRLKRAHALLRERLDREHGDRWSLALLPLLGTKPPVPLAPAAAAGAGAIAMGMKTKIAIAVGALLLLTVGGAWTFRVLRPLPDGDPVVAPVMPDSLDRQEPDRRLSVTGIVRRRCDGTVVAGARAAIGDATAITDEAGRFRLRDAAPGVLRVSATGCRPADSEVPGEAGDEVDLGVVWLDSTGRIVFEVLGEADAALPGATVEIRRVPDHGAVARTHSYLRGTARPDFGHSRLATKTTDATGRAVFEGLAAGPYVVVARHEDHATVAPSGVYLAAGAAEARETIRLPRAHRLEGRLVTAEGGPAEGWLVRGSGPDWDEASYAKTDADGRFVLDRLPAGPVPIRVSRSRGYYPALAVVTIPDVKSVTLTLPALGTVAGRVARPDGRPVEAAEVGIEVRWNEQTHCAIVATDADGRYRFDQLPTGRITRFEVRKPGVFLASPRLVVGEFLDGPEGHPTGDSANVLPGETNAIDVTMRASAQVHGRVLGPDGPVAGAWVYMHRRPTRGGQVSETAVADGRGRYEFPSVAPGTIGVTVIHPGYVHPEAPQDLPKAIADGSLSPALLIEVLGKGDVERDLHVVAGYEVRGRVVRESGEPVAGATVRVVQHQYSSRPPLATVTDETGAFRFARAVGGKDVTLTAESPGLCPRSCPVLTAEHGPIDVEIVLVPRPTLRVLVADAAGAPMAEASVSARIQPSDRRVGSPESIALRTGTDGIADVRPGCAAGRATLRVSATGHGSAKATADFGPESPGETLAIRLPALSDVAGRVVFEDGSPVAGARLSLLDPSKPDCRVAGRRWPPASGGAAIRAFTDGRGGFLLAGVPEGANLLVVRGGGAAETQARFEAPVENLTVLALRAATLRVRARDEEGRPMPHAAIGVRPVAPGPWIVVDDPSPLVVTPGSPWKRLADAEGLATFDDLAPGEYHASVFVPSDEPPGWRTTRIGPVSTGDRIHEVVVEAPPETGALTGTILGPDGAWPAGSRVQYVVQAEDGTRGPPPQFRNLAADGRFEIRGLTASRYKLHVWASLGRQGGTIRRVFRGLRPGREERTLVVTKGRSISGRLRDEDGSTLGGARLTALPTSDPDPRFTYDAVVAEDGSFEITDLEEGTYELWLRSPGRASENLRLAERPKVAAGTGGLLLTATREVRIRAVVKDTGGALLASRTFALWPAGGDVALRVVLHVTTDERGVFAVTGLHPDTRYNIAPVVEGNERGGYASPDYEKVVTITPGDDVPTLTFGK